MKVFLLCGVLCVALLAAAPSRAGEAGGAGATIEIKDYVYTPAALNIHAGDTVTWINRDEVPHTIVEKNLSFRSAALDTGDSFRHVFAKPGTYIYFCSLHPTMTGTVTVAP